MGADVLWSRGFLGQGQTVAILDEGFGGPGRVDRGGILPPRSAMIRSSSTRWGRVGLSEIGLPTQHGVRMAEIVHDLAPDARLVLVGYRTIPSSSEAAAWIAAQGIPIVSHSNSFLTPPFDGTGRAARAVDAAAAAGCCGSTRPATTPSATGAAAPRPPAVVPIAPAAGTPLILSLAWAPPSAVASVAVERADAAGAWTEVQRSTPAGPGNAVTTLLVATAAPTGSWCARSRAPPPSSTLLPDRRLRRGRGGRGQHSHSGRRPGRAHRGGGQVDRGHDRPYSSQGAAGAAKPDLVGPPT